MSMCDRPTRVYWDLGTRCPRCDLRAMAEIRAHDAIYVTSLHPHQLLPPSYEPWYGAIPHKTSR